MGALPIVGTSANEIIRPNHVSPTVTGGAPTVDGDTIESLGGNDVVAGGLGDDEIHLGAGNDRSIWNVGDGNDFVFGGQGVDTVEMRGSGSFDRFELGRSPSASADANANAIHDLVSANLPLTGIEHVFFRPLGGADIVLVDDLTGTHISQVVVDLAPVPGATQGDGETDQVEVHGGDARELITLTETSAGVKIAGLSAETLVKHFDSGADADLLTVKGYGGDDRIDASGMTANALRLSLQGGNGKDTIIGGAGRDDLAGDNGRDVLIGGKGGDSLDGGSGSDSLTGGQGRDEFIFGAPLGKGVDTVTDFIVGIDKIALNGGIFTLTGASLDAAQFHIGAAAADGDDHIIYTAKTGALSYDADGVGGADAVQFATLAKHLLLTEHDFEVLI